MSSTLRRLRPPMSGTLTQAASLAQAEWLRLLGRPVWAMLAVLWTLVCALYFDAALAQAARDALPASESALSWFFRFFPGLLPLLLVIFVPQLTLDAIAGRRENGRLEQLLAAGLRPGALVLGAWLAVLGLGLVLLLPPLLFQLLLPTGLRGEGGQLLGGLLALQLQIAAVAALGLCAGAWTPSRASAGLVATAIGLLWWILDAFGGGGRGAGEPGPLALAATVHGFATGLIAWQTVGGFALLTACLLLGARLGLTLREAPLPRLVTTSGLALVLLLGLVDLRGCPHSSALGGMRDDAPAAELAATIARLAADEPLRASLLIPAHSRLDPIDGPAQEAMRALLGRLAGPGLQLEILNPDRNPARAAALIDMAGLDQGIERPVLILARGIDTSAVTAASVVHVERREGRRQLAALRVQTALAEALRELEGGRPLAAWPEGLGLRPALLAEADRRGMAVGAWQRATADAGLRVVPLHNWAVLGQQPFRLLILAGPSRDPSAPALAAIEAHLARGGHLLLALDPNQDEPLPELARICARYGIAWGTGRLRALAGAIRVEAAADEGPVAGVARRGPLRSRHAIALSAMPRDGRQLRGWLAAGHQASKNIELELDGVRHPIAGARPLLLTSLPSEGDGPRLAVLADVDLLSDAHLDQGGARALASALARWLAEPERSAVAPLEPDRRRLLLEPGRLLLLRLVGGLLLPLLAIAAGLGCWWWRRRP